MNQVERDFLVASIEQEYHDSLEREAQRQRELEAAQKLAQTEHRAATRLRQRAFYLAGAFLLAIVLAGAALLFSRQARAEQQAAQVRELSASAISNLSTNPERSILLALEAVNINLKNNQPVLVEAQDALHRSIETSHLIDTLHVEDSGSVWALTVSPDGKRMATIGEDRTVRIWGFTTNKVFSTLQVDTDFAQGGSGLAFSSNGKQLLTVSGEANATLWDVATGKAILNLEGHSAHVSSVAISSDGKMFATGSDDGTAKLWDASIGKELFTLGDEETLANKLHIDIEAVPLREIESAWECTDFQGKRIVIIP